MQGKRVSNYFKELEKGTYEIIGFQYIDDYLYIAEARTEDAIIIRNIPISPTNQGTKLYIKNRIIKSRTLCLLLEKYNAVKMHFVLSEETETYFFVKQNSFT